MKKTKLIISILFIILIVAEICIGTYMAYSYCMEETKKLGVALLGIYAPILAAFIIIPELEILHVILYFVSDKKSKKYTRPFLIQLKEYFRSAFCFLLSMIFLIFLQSNYLQIYFG